MPFVVSVSDTRAFGTAASELSCYETSYDTKSGLSSKWNYQNAENQHEDPEELSRNTPMTSSCTTKLG